MVRGPFRWRSCVRSRARIHARPCTSMPVGIYWLGRLRTSSQAGKLAPSFSRSLVCAFFLGGRVPKPFSPFEWGREIGLDFLSDERRRFSPVRRVLYLGGVQSDLTTQLADELVFIECSESLGVADRLSIEMIVRTVERIEGIENALAEDGVVVRGSKRQPRAHPLLGIERQLRADVTRELERLDLTPEARRRALVRGEWPTDSALADLLTNASRT